MKKNLFVINKNERSRILNMHETATKNNYVFEQEEPVQYYKDAQGKVIKLTGYKSPPLGSEPSTASEYLAQNQGTEQKTVVSDSFFISAKKLVYFQTA